MKERKVWQAILETKCPNCRKGNLFTHGPYDLKHFGDMPEHCEECGFRFEREPGFFFGSMYISYMLSVGIFLTVSAILYFVFNDPGLEIYLLCVALASLLLYPLTFRYSRAIFVTIFGGADGKPLK